MGLDPLEDVDFERVRFLFQSTWRYLSASHDNAGHFQEPALRNHTYWHAAALAHARAGNSGLALLAEAYAVHFLEDFFAPGHMVVHRETIGDLPALSEHDRVNRKGLPFTVREAALEDLFSSLDVAAEVAFSEAELEFARPEAWATVRSRLGESRSVHLFGDGSLRDQPAQFALVAAAASVSIREVLSSLRGCSVLMSLFSRYVWVDDVSGCPGRAQVAFPALFPKAGNGIGDWNLSSERAACAFHQHLRTWPVVVVSPAIEAFWQGDEETIRGSLDLEVLVLTFVLPEWVTDSKTNEAVAFPFSSPSLFWGLSLVLDESTTAIGPTWRISYPLTRTDLAFSLVHGARYFTRPEEEWNFMAGLRADWGMGVVALTLGAYYDARDQGGALRHDWCVRAGVSIGIPTSLFMR